MEYLGLLLVLLAGIGNPVQTGANATVRRYVHTPILASTVSFSVGLLTLMVLTLFTIGQLIPSATAVSDLPWWAWGGGAIGAIGLTGSIVLFPKLGGVLTVLMPMIGQILMSILIDSFGWFGTAPIPFGTGRVVGLLLVTTGLLLYMREKLRHQRLSGGTGMSQRTVVGWSLLGVFFGLSLALQPVMNGRLGMAISSSIHAAFISFVFSTVILVALVLLLPAERRNIPLVFSTKRPWWSWTGGLIGAYFVTVYALVTPLMGVGLVTLTGIFGMLLSSTLIDRRGLFGTPPVRISTAQYAALLLLFAGVVIIKLS
jgi:transporter family-2 protein